MVNHTRLKIGASWGHEENPSEIIETKDRSVTKN
jgi:hypothetical protein